MVEIYSRTEVSTDTGLIELTPEEARLKREHFLALAEKNAKLGEGASDDVDSADSTMATLFLPGG